MKYKTCVSVAQETPQEMYRDAARALEVSEYAELRLDYLKPADIGEALDLTKKMKRRLVYTVRPASEGGRFSGIERERRSVLRLAAEYGPRLLDIEYSAISHDQGLRRYVKRTGTDVLVSWHDFEKTPTLSALSKRLKQMGRISQHVKIVTSAKTEYDAATVLSLYAQAGKTKLIAFAMGELGRISRVLCLYLGSPYTYVAQGRSVAPGQFTVSEMKRITSLA